jgi:hypothetical protein
MVLYIHVLVTSYYIYYYTYVLSRFTDYFHLISLFHVILYSTL